jgi:predicted MFS family arabinose efflux permease
MVHTSGFAVGVAKIGATFGAFVLPILKGKFGVPAVLGMMAAVSVLGLVVTLVFGHEDTED